MKKLIFILPCFVCLNSFGQSTYNMNYATINAGLNTSSTFTVKGNLFVRGLTGGTSSDSVSTVVNGRFYKVPRSGFVNTTGTQTISGLKTFTDVLTGIESIRSYTDANNFTLIGNGGKVVFANGTVNQLELSPQRITGNRVVKIQNKDYTLADSADVATIVGNYVTLNTNQTVGGEKTWIAAHKWANSTYGNQTANINANGFYATGINLANGYQTGLTTEGVTFMVPGNTSVGVISPQRMSADRNWKFQNKSYTLADSADVAAISGNYVTTNTQQTITGDKYWANGTITTSGATVTAPLKIVNQAEGSIWSMGVGGISNSNPGGWNLYDGVNSRIAVDSTGVVNIAKLAGTGTRSVQTNSAGDLSAGPILASGTYLPTVTNVANVSSSTAIQCFYQRVGNIVTVSGQVQVTPTAGAATTTDVGISLPIASNLGNSNDLRGPASLNYASLTSANVFCFADSTNDRATIRLYSPVSATSLVVMFEFKYVII